MNGAPTLAVPDADGLNTLMSGLRRCLADNAAQVADGLPALLNMLQKFAFSPGEATQQLGFFEANDVPSLAIFFGALRAPFEAVEASGVMSNPWAAATLRRDEVRNASVLRWFLDPRGGHGCGDTILVNLLERIKRHFSGFFPTNPSQWCSVAVEESPDGDRTNRVDIQIDDPGFYLVIEVKIGAPEQDGQVKRYCDIAVTRAAGVRPWAVVFLTLNGKAPTTAGDQIGHVVPIAWKHVAAALRQTARTASDTTRFLAISFATHITNL